MRTAKILDMTRGWYIGNFSPTFFSTNDFEVAHHHHKSGSRVVPHYHKIAREINYIINGKCIVSGKELNTGDIFEHEIYDVADILFLEDTDIIVVKVPSVKDDKYFDEDKNVLFT